MSLLKPAECKKIFVRNVEQPLPKTEVVYECEEEKKKNASVSAKTCSSVSTSDVNKVKSKISLDEPNLNSAWKMVNQMNSLKEINSKKSVQLDRKKQPILQEKALKHLNFPYYKSIYKDLIPLCVKEPSVKSKLTVPREPMSPRDIEPVLSDFVKIKPRSEYNYQVPLQKPEKSVVRNYDGHRIYKIISTWPT